MTSHLLGKGDICSITPAFINSDIVENHFCQQRGTCNGLNKILLWHSMGHPILQFVLDRHLCLQRATSSQRRHHLKEQLPCPLNKNKKETKSFKSQISFVWRQSDFGLRSGKT